MPRSLAVLGMGLGLIAAACGEAADEVAPTGPEEVVEAPPPGRTWERSLIFVGGSPDSLLIVPTVFEAQARPGGVDRRIRAWLHRSGAWESFLDESWQTPETSSPWRLLPRPSMRLVVGQEDAIVRLIHETEARSLEVELLDTRAEWSASTNEALALSDGRLQLSSAEVDGVVFDLNRARETADGPAGDFTVLVSGDSLQIVLHTPQVQDLEIDSVPLEPWGGFVRANFRTIPVTDAVIDWTARQAFYEARRDVPRGWAISSAQAGLWVSLRVQTALLSAGAGPGPRFPVEGLFTVTGRVVLEGLEYPVSGLYRHTQGWPGRPTAAAPDPGGAAP
jgi:hypothetical protein